jgi:cytochrome c oxidase subunit 2
MESKFIILLVVIVAAIAIAQLVRVYELSSKLRGKTEHEISSKDNNFNALLLLLFMFFQFFGFIYLMLEYGWTGRGDAASVEGKETDWLLNLNFVIIIIVFFFTNALLFYFSYKYVKKPGVPAYYYPHNNKLEMLWTVVPACVLAVIIILGLKSWNELTSEGGSDAKVVELYSKQFDWTARYAGKNNKLGKFDYKLTTGNNELGLVTSNTIDSAIHQMSKGLSGIEAIQAKLNNPANVLSDSTQAALEKELSAKERMLRLLIQMKENHNPKIDNDAWDDIIQKDTLYLCVNQLYEFKFRAMDVIHSAFFPHFRAQMNTVPGVETRFKFTPDITTKDMRTKMKNENFNFILMCNKICGGAHYKMKMIVVVLPKDQYKAWEAKKMKETFKDKYFPAPVAAAPANGEKPDSDDKEKKDTINSEAILPEKKDTTKKV